MNKKNMFIMLNLRKKIILAGVLAVFLGVSLSSNTFASAKIGKCHGGTQDAPKNADIEAKCKKGNGNAVMWINNVKDNDSNAAITTESSNMSTKWNGSSDATMDLYLRGAYIDSKKRNDRDAYHIILTNSYYGNVSYKNVSSVNFITQASGKLNRGTNIDTNTRWSTGWGSQTVKLNIKKFINAATKGKSCGTNCTTYTYKNLRIYRCPSNSSPGDGDHMCGTGYGVFTLTLKITVDPQYQYQYKLSKLTGDGQTGYDFETSTITDTGSKTEGFTGSLTSILNGTEKASNQSLTISKTSPTSVSYGFKSSLSVKSGGSTHGVANFPKYRITNGGTTITETGTLPTGGGVNNNLYNFTNSFTPAAGSTNKSCRKLEYASSVTYTTTTKYKRPYAKKKFKQTIAIRRRSRSWNFGNKKWNGWSAWSYDKNSNKGWTSTTYSTYDDALSAAKKANSNKYNSTISKALDKVVTFYSYTSNETKDRVYKNSLATDKSNGTTTYAHDGSSGKTYDKSITRCITITSSYTYQEVVYEITGRVTAQAKDGTVSNGIINGNNNTKSYANTTGNIYVKDNNFQATFGGRMTFSKETTEGEPYLNSKHGATEKEAITVGYSITPSDSTNLSKQTNKSWTLYAKNSNSMTKTHDLTATETTSSRTALSAGQSNLYSQKLCYDSKIYVEEGSDGTRKVFDREQTCVSAGLNFHYPFNFDTSLTTSTGDIIYSGSNATVSFTNTVQDRINPLVQGEKYTATPSNLSREGAIFLVPDGVDVENEANGLGKILSGSVDTPRNTNTSDLCKAIKQKLGATNYNNYIKNCYPVKDTSKSKEFTVPDNHFGDKICVIAGINYADSHNAPNQDLENVEPILTEWNSTNRDNTNFAANKWSVSDNTTASSGNPNWRLSALSCAVIAETPTFQTWNAGFQSDNNVKTRVFSRVPGATLDFSKKQTGARTYGSWTETFFIAGGDSTGLASASALGYPNGNSTNHTCDLSKISLANVGTARIDIEKDEEDEDGDTISFTEVSAACEGENASQADQYILGSNISANSGDKLTQLENRYTTNLESGDGYFTGENMTINNDKFYNLTTGSTSIDYQQYDGNVTINNVLNIARNTKTRVLKVNGTLTINRNICLGNGRCNTNSTLTLASRNDESFNDTTSISQLIIIADDINIGKDVDQIDAWLIANKTDESDNLVGKINTCATDNRAECNKTIIFNGPIITGSIILNRTNRNSGNGANLTYNSNLNNLGAATPAEIFNLRPDITFWSYSQSTRSTPASTVYIAELAPRL